MNHRNFRERREHELYGLSDEELLRYMQTARGAGRADALESALAVLVYGYWGIVLQRVRLRIPDADVEDVAHTAVASAVTSAFDGRSVGELRSWLHTIVDRRIADYHRSRERKPRLDPLPTEHLGEEQIWGEEPSVDFEGDAFDARRALRRANEELSESHRRVVDLYVLGPRSAADAAAQVPGMTEANVHQIASRFQRRFRELLEEGDTSP